MTSHLMEVAARLIVEKDERSFIEPRIHPPTQVTEQSSIIEPPNSFAIPVEGPGLKVTPTLKKDDLRGEAWVNLRGTYADGEFHAQQVLPWVEAVDFWHPGPSNMVDIEGTWSSTLPNPSPSEEMELEMLHSGEIICRRYLRVASGGRIVAIAASNPENCRSRLKNSYANNLHVFKSPWTKLEYDQAHNYLTDQVHNLNISHIGDRINPSLMQDVIIVSIRCLTENFEEWLQNQPKQMLDVRPWLRRVGTITT